MCDFISWIEKDGNVLFLTANDVFNTKRGKQLQKHVGGEYDEDLVGHGAIEFFYHLEHGKYTHCECSNFNTPKIDFPEEIIKAMKNGEFRGMGNPDEIQGLLNKRAQDRYDKKSDKLWRKHSDKHELISEQYYKDKDRSLAERNGKPTLSLACEFNETSDREYDKAIKTCQDAFWDLFADPKNRPACWR